MAHELCTHSSLPMFLCWGEMRQVYGNDACDTALGVSPSESWQVLHAHLDAVFATASPLSDVRCVVRDAHGEERHFNCGMNPLLQEELPGPERCIGVLVHACDITAQVTGLRRVQALQQLAEHLLPVTSLPMLWDAIASQGAQSALFDGVICKRIDEQHGEVVLSTDRQALLKRGQRIDLQLLPPLHLELRMAETVCGWLMPAAQDSIEQAQTLVGLINVTIARVQAVDLALQEATTRRDLFIGRLAHELRNPIAAVAAAAQLLRKATDHPVAAASAREALTRQISVMTQVLNELQDASRAVRGNLTLHRAPQSLHEVLLKAIEAVRPQLESKHQLLEVVLVDRRLQVEGDALRLNQVFVHLLLNAHRFTPENGAITLTTHAEQDEAVVRITDTGSGITPQALPWLFELCRPREVMPLLTGLGVGLPIAHGIVRLHGGELSARSEGTNMGSEFCVRLPLLRRDSPTLSGTVEQH